jgi:hypothetical protein
MQQAVMCARQIDAHRIEVTGFRGSVLLSDGKLFVEKDGIARQRAEQVGQLLHEVGVATDELVVKWIEMPAKATGDEGFKQRRVTMTVKPKSVALQELRY